MFGYVSYRAPGEDAPPVRTIRGARFRAVYVESGTGPRAKRSARAAARALSRAGVREAVFSADCAYRAEFARRGTLGVSPVPLYRATAAALAREALARREVDASRATVAFAAERVSAEFERAVTALAAEVRYVTLAVPFGGEAFARALKREYGVAARLAAPEEPLRADLTLCFDAPREADGPVLPLYDAALAVEYDAEEQNALLAALWRCGALDAEALGVRKIVTAFSAAPLSPAARPCARDSSGPSRRSP